MTDLQTIKKAGFKIKRIESDHKGVFGGKCNHVVALQNEKGETLHFENLPYYPAGRRNAFAALIESGSLNTKYFTFKTL